VNVLYVLDRDSGIKYHYPSNVVVGIIIIRLHHQGAGGGEEKRK